MILADTSAWVEYLRKTGSAANVRMRVLVQESGRLATTDVVLMEILAGARDDRHREELRRLLARCEMLPVEGLSDYESAAEAYRTCRRGGDTIRKLTDCLIAVVAMRAGAQIISLDADFEAIARHLPLTLA